ncbi:MAG: hypothetical protein RLZZ196_527 [Bacteroidota bacterium]|jgi:hypothetical protein
MFTRDALTKIFLQQWGKSIDDANVQLYARKWWQSNRASKQLALRLSEEGFDFLTNTLEIKMYEIPFTEPIELSPQTLIFLEKYIDCPYFLTTQSITVFSERKSFELYVFSDDIRKFGLVKAMNERQKELSNQNSI